MVDGGVREKMFGNHRPAGCGLLGWVLAGVEYGEVWISGMYCLDVVSDPKLNPPGGFNWPLEKRVR